MNLKELEKLAGKHPLKVELEEAIREIQLLREEHIRIHNRLHGNKKNDKGNDNNKWKVVGKKGIKLKIKKSVKATVESPNPFAVLLDECSSSTDKETEVKKEHISRMSSLESISPPLVTPARANTPTEAKQSAALARPQIVGGSLATYSAVDTARTVNNSHSRNNEVGQPNGRLRQLSETSRNSLPPTKLPFRPGRMPPETPVMAIPPTPPPTAAGDGMRKGGRVHLQPLTIRKTSN
nr:cyclin-dependent kinase 12-like [Cherax quadricarinatus]